jgi:hypothetical protein
VNLGRTVGVIAAVLVTVGAAVYFFFRYSFTAEGLYKVQTAVGVDARRPERHIVPEDFRGWAVLRFGIEAAEPLPIDDQALIIEYPPNGRLDTSYPPPNEDGFLHREYFRRTADGLSPLHRAGDVWGEYTMRAFVREDGTATGVSTGFFVGSLTEFRRAERPHALSDLPELPEIPPD